MLKILRKQKVAKKIFYVLAIIIIPAFIFWGSVSVIRSRDTKGYTGKIFGKKIPFDEYRNALHAWQTQLKIKFGDKAPQVEKLFGSNQGAWDRLTLRAEAKNRNIKIDNTELTSHITSLPFLQKDGVFDPELYDLFLRYSLNTPPRIFEEEIRENLKFQKLFDQVTTDVKVNEEELKEKYKQDKEQIKVKYIGILSKDLEKDIKIDGNEVKAYYEGRKEEFKSPIQINLNYIGMDFPKDATQEQKEEIEKKADELHNFLSEGNDFIKVKEKFDLETKETGFFSLGEPVPEIGWTANYQELFNLNEKQLSEVSETPKGLHIFQLKEKRTDYLPTFEEAKEKIENIVKQQKSKELAKTKTDDLYSKIKSKKELNSNLGLSELAKELSLTVKETEFFAKNAFVADIGFSKEFSEKAFSLKKGEISEPIEINQGYFIIELSEFQPIDEKEFEKEKETLKETLLQEKKNKTFEDFFAKLKEKAKIEDYTAENTRRNTQNIQ